MTRVSIARRGKQAAALSLFALFALAGCQSPTSDPTAGTIPTGSEFREAAVGASAGAPTLDTAPLGIVYFDYDRYEIRGDARPVLEQNAALINGRAEWGVVTIEGHCDERGSQEYNVALGARRASYVKRYLVDLGVPSSRLGTVSFGEAQPAVSGNRESAFRYNRRSEFKTASN